MEGTEISVTVDFGAIRQALDSIGAETLPRTAAAVHDSTLMAQRLWLSIAGGNEVEFQGRRIKITRRTGAYARSISEGLEYPADGDQLHGRVASSSPYAEAIEKGTPAHDMKEGLLNGPRARRSKKGTRYTIIAFRHNTPGQTATGPAMPMEIYKKAQKLAFSTVTGRRTEKNAHGQDVQRPTYAWGGRGKRTTIGWRSRIAPAGREYTHETSIYSGMVKMGKKGHASYLTFRVVSENSPANSWWSKGTDPKPVSEAVAAQIGPQAETLIRAAFEQDIEALING
jgi:hypothetical protein